VLRSFLFILKNTSEKKQNKIKTIDPMVVFVNEKNIEYIIHFHFLIFVNDNEDKNAEKNVEFS
jgi:plasmid rolling circle replication initiator protein Rep